MRRFSEWCLKAKFVLVEVATLLGFSGIVVCGVYFEYRSIYDMVHK